MPDPMTMMMIMNAINGVGAMATSNKGEMGSTYNKRQQGLIGDVVNQVKGMGQQGNVMNSPNYQSGSNWLQSLFNDPSFFNSFEAPLMRQYEESTIPDLANRFAGMGSGGALGSTGFRNQATREAGNLHANIAALRGGMQQQGANQALAYAQAPAQNYFQMLQNALTPTQNVYQPPSAGPFGGAFSAGMGGMMQGLMNQAYSPSMGGGGGMNPNMATNAATLPWS
jgi:hypothetical protein